MHPTKQLSFLEKLSFIGIVIRLPFKLLVSAVLSPYLKRFKKKRFNRVLNDAAVKHLTDHASVNQMQWMNGTSLDVYRSWAKKRAFSPLVEDLEGNSKLLWLTRKTKERVLIYVHGGGYMIPATDDMLSFIARLHQELSQRDDSKNFGAVAVLYSLHPAKFPTQLTELTVALTSLVSAGVKPEDMVLIGDSAGGNLVTQLLVHTLHPFEGVPPSPLVNRQPLRGVCLISPWFSLDTPTPSHTRNDDLDVIHSASFVKWGKNYLEGVPESCLPWIKPVTKAPHDHWFRGLEQHTDRVLITVGDRECLYDDGIQLHDALRNSLGPEFDLQQVLDENGVHEDPIFDATIPRRDGRLSEATMRIFSWVGDAFRVDVVQ